MLTVSYSVEVRRSSNCLWTSSRTIISGLDGAAFRQSGLSGEAPSLVSGMFTASLPL